MWREYEAREGFSAEKRISTAWKYPSLALSAHAGLYVKMCDDGLSICTSLLHLFKYEDLWRPMTNRSHRKTARSKPASWGIIRLPQFGGPVLWFWDKLYSAAFHTVLHCLWPGSYIKNILYFILGDRHFSHMAQRDLCLSGVYWSMKLVIFRC